MKYKAFIVEDELMNSEFLQNLIRGFCPQIEIIGVAATAEDAIDGINQNKPQLVFMDIELQTATGFDVLQQVKEPSFEIIFTTAYDHYAIKAIKFSAIDYLLKPINFEELTAAVDKAIETLQVKQRNDRLELLLKNIRQPTDEDFCISLATSEGVEFIPLRQIVRLEAKGPYTNFFLKNDTHLMVCKNLKEYEMLLTDYGFFRIHNSHMINMKEIKKMIKTDGGYAVMSDGGMIAISPRKREEFMALLSQRLV